MTREGSHKETERKDWKKLRKEGNTLKSFHFLFSLTNPFSLPFLHLRIENGRDGRPARLYSSHRELAFSFLHFSSHSGQDALGKRKGKETDDTEERKRDNEIRIEWK